MRAAVDLLQDALEMPVGAARLQALDGAARAADAENDDITALSARESLVDDANDVGDPERMLQAFTWCLAHHDKSDRDEGPGDELLWRYKWVIDVLPGFPQISRPRIAAVLDDFERRFRAAGNLMRAVHAHRATNAARLGDVDDARLHLSRHHAVARDALADCHACEADAEVELLVSIGDPAAALEAATSILAGHLSCAEVPARTWAHVLLPLLDVAMRCAPGSEAEQIAADAALGAHLKGMRGLAALGDKKVEVADAHLTFLAVTGNFVRALNLLKRIWPLAIAHTSPQTRMRVHAAASCLLQRIARSQHPHTVQAPANLQLPAESATNAAALAQWLEQDALAIAARFDARNLNDAVTRSVRHTLQRAARPWDRPFSKQAITDDE